MKRPLSPSSASLPFHESPPRRRRRSSFRIPSPTWVNSPTSGNTSPSPYSLPPPESPVGPPAKYLPFPSRIPVLPIGIHLGLQAPADGQRVFSTPEGRQIPIPCPFAPDCCRLPFPWRVMDIGPLWLIWDTHRD